MKFAAVAVALLSTSSAMSVHQQTASHGQALSSLHSEPADQKNVESGRHAQVVTQALAGAPPGEISMPEKRPDTDVENDV